MPVRLFVFSLPSNERKAEVMKRIYLILMTCCIFMPVVAGAQTTVTDTICLTLGERLVTDSVRLDEVLVKRRRTPMANSRWSDLSPVELVTVGGANGDLYRALQTLPGTQIQGETGRLLVRGGDDSETQTYIDGMHVLMPYTSVGIGASARSRYSTFMFSGINLASGGAPLEYGGALSAVLPLETKDYSTIDKLGLNASVVGMGGGGTRTFGKGSVSVDLNYQNMALHNLIYPGRKDFGSPYQLMSLETKDYSTIDKLGLNASVVGMGGGGTRTFGKGSVSVDLNYQNMALHNLIYPGRKDFGSPYQLMSGATQLRFTPDSSTVAKFYAQYDRTDFSTYEGGERRLFGLDENNVYLNATLRRTAANGWEWFVGGAWSYNYRTVKNAAVDGDTWLQRQQEWHLKAKLGKRLSPLFRVDGGAEAFIRNYDVCYCMGAIGKSEGQVSPSLGAAFLSVASFPLERLKAEASMRAEYRWQSEDAEVSPRLALSWYQGDVVLTAVVGRYTQLAADSLLMKQNELKPAVCWQYNAGAQYNRDGRLAKAEVYYKKYSRLPLWEATSVAGMRLTSGGYGYSKGIDLFWSDRTTLKNFEYQLAYTYNIPRRKTEYDSELTVPQYATRHNASVVVKWAFLRLRTVLSLTDRFSSGRPWHNPERTGLMNDEVKPYNSLDVGLTFLPSKKVIIHTSATNLLGRCNEFGRVAGRPVLAASDRFFYIGVFVTLGRHAAYDVSNF